MSVMAVIRTSKINRAEMVEGITHYNEGLDLPIATGMWSIDSQSGLSAIGREIDRQAAMIGYDNAFWLYTVCCFASLPFLLLVRIRKK